MLKAFKTFLGKLRLLLRMICSFHWFVYLSAVSVRFLLFNSHSSLYIPAINPCGRHSWQILNYPVHRLCALLVVSLAVWKLLSVPGTISCATGDLFRRSCLCLYFEMFSLFASSHFSMSGFKFRPWIHFELNFVQNETYRFDFTLLQVDIHVCRDHLFSKLATDV